MIRVLVFLAALFASSAALAQGTPVQTMCYTGNPAPNQWVPCTVNLALPIRSGEYGVTPYAAPQYCQITSLSSATTLVTANCATGTILAKASIAQICVETQAVRYTSSGVVTPTSTVGMPAAAGSCFQYAGPLSTIQFIQQSSGAILDVETFP
jgi:hypothetical protein